MSWNRHQCSCAPEARGGHSAVVLGSSHVVIFGGNADPRRQTLLVDPAGSRRGCILGDARVFDINTMCWASVDAVGQNPAARYAHAASSLGENKMVIHGGHDGEKWLDDLVIMELVGPQRTPHWIYPSSSGQVPGPRHGHTLTEVGNKLFMFGGYCNDIYYNDVFVIEFDTDRARWSRVVPNGRVPTPRAYHTATLIDKNFLMVFGGRGSDGGYLQEVMALDLSTMRWFSPQFLNDPPSARAHHSAALFGTKLYIIGGQNGQSSFLNDVHMLHNGKWHIVSFNGAPMSARSRHTASLLKGNHLVIFGGYDGSSWMNDILLVDMDFAQLQNEISKMKERVEYLEGGRMDKLTLSDIDELEESYLVGLKSLGKVKSEAIRREYESKLARNLEHTSIGGAVSPLSPITQRTIMTDSDHNFTSLYGTSSSSTQHKAGMSRPISSSATSSKRSGKQRVHFGFAETRFYQREQGGGGGLPASGAAPLGLGWEVLKEERNAFPSSPESPHRSPREQPYARVGSIPEEQRIHILREFGATDHEFLRLESETNEIRQYRYESLLSPTDNPLYLREAAHK